jgi:hypothetical protein
VTTESYTGISCDEKRILDIIILRIIRISTSSSLSLKAILKKSTKLNIYLDKLLVIAALLRYLYKEKVWKSLLYLKYSYLIYPTIGKCNNNYPYKNS